MRREKAASDTVSARFLTLDFPTPGMVRNNKYLLFKPSCLWLFVLEAQAD